MFRTSMIHTQERLQAVCCKFGMCYLRTTRYVQMLGGYRKNFLLQPHNIWKNFFLQPPNIWTYRVVRKLPHTRFATYSL